MLARPRTSSTTTAARSRSARRDARGVIVTVIADNYFGYCKKEVKTQISYSANLFGNCRGGARRRRAGLPQLQPGRGVHRATAARRAPHARRGARARPRAVRAAARGPRPRPQLAATSCWCPRRRALQPARRRPCRGAAPTAGRLDPAARRQGATCSPTATGCRWTSSRGDRTAWRLVGTVARRHRLPQARTVSGGGKSEISKAITDAFIFGPVFVADFERRHGRGRRDPRPRLRRPLRRPGAQRRRPPADPVARERSLGSVIKLLTPSERDYTAEYNAWLRRASRSTSRSSSTWSSAPTGPSGATTGAATSASTIINGRPGNELQLDGEQDRRQHAAGRLRRRRLLARCSACATTSTPPSRCRPRTTSPPRRSCPAASSAWTPDALVQARGELRGRCSSSAPTTPSTAATTSRPSATSPRPGTFLSNFEPLDPGRRARDASRTRWRFSAFTEPMAGADRAPSPTRPRAGTGVLRVARRTRGWWTASRRRTRATCSCGPTWRDAREHRRRRAGRPPAAAGCRPDAPLTLPVDVVAAGRRNNPPEAGVPPAVLVQPAALHGAARAVHGVHLLDDRQVAVDDRGRVRGRADQGPVQRAAGDHRPQRRAAVLRPHRLRRLGVRRRLRRAAACASTTTSACSCRSCSPG